MKRVFTIYPSLKEIDVSGIIEETPQLDTRVYFRKGYYTVSSVLYDIDCGKISIRLKP